MTAVTANDVTVVIPAYNSAKTIGATIASALGQTTPPAQIYVMDDGSTDETADLVGEFGDRVRLLRQENRGVSTARNELLRRTSSSLVAFLDSDDIWHAQLLEHLLLGFVQEPDAVVSFAGFHTVGERVQVLPPKEPVVVDGYRVYAGDEFLESFIAKSGIILPSFSLVRRSALEQIGTRPFPSDLHGSEDMYLWYRLALMGPFVRVVARLGYYRLVTGSLSDDRLRVFRDRMNASAKILQAYRQIAPSWAPLALRHYHISCRQAAKFSLGAREVPEAREHLRRALRESWEPKTLGLFIATYLPEALRPTPSRFRSKEAATAQGMPESQG